MFGSDPSRRTIQRNGEPPSCPATGRIVENVVRGHYVTGSFASQRRDCRYGGEWEAAAFFGHVIVCGSMKPAKGFVVFLVPAQA
mmetsp:Transcript_17741/g.39122  ORF Transcript_17741/g.39122 Transcript_17741/m.39122 type:complete len:84 (+) Transcript_17741:2316-2567(+)